MSSSTFSDKSGKSNEEDGGNIPPVITTSVNQLKTDGSGRGSLLFQKYSGLTIITIAALVPLFLWLPSAIRQFSWRSMGQIMSLTGTVLLSINFILSGRFRFLEKFFDGLNRMYIYHHLIGEIALILLLLHPMFISFFYLSISFQAAFDIIFPPLSDFATWFGMAALLTLITFLILTLYIKLPYDVWKLTHKFLGLALALAIVHIFFITSSITTNLPLRFYVLGFCTLALISYTYRTLLGRYLVKRHKYKVLQVKVLGDVTEVTLLPEKKGMNYLPGQFIFIKFNSLGITNEEHPFSLTSDTSEPTISISAKSVGLYTETLKLLKPDTDAAIEGPFGAFSYLTKPRTKQVWIAGGIGVTPFVSMAKNMSAQNGYDVVLYYVVSLPEEAVYLPLLEEQSKRSPNLKVVPIYTKTQGRLSAETVKANMEDLLKRDILVCGPPPMMKSLREQFNELGMRNFHIFSEEFSID